MVLLRFLLFSMLFSQPACSQKADKAVLLMNASVHQGNGAVIENAALAYQGEKITLLADARLIRLDMSVFKVVEAYGLHIYPAALVNETPAFVSVDDSLYYTGLQESSKVLLTTNKLAVELPFTPLEEGTDATFVVTEQALKQSTAQIRYLLVKGKMKQENKLSLHLLGQDQ